MTATLAITVVDHSGARPGVAAADRLIARLADPALAVEHIRLPAAIIERGSGDPVMTSTFGLAGPVLGVDFDLCMSIAERGSGEIRL